MIIFIKRGQNIPGQLEANIGKRFFTPSLSVDLYLRMNSFCDSSKAKSSAIVISTTISAPSCLKYCASLAAQSFGDKL